MNIGPPLSPHLPDLSLIDHRARSSTPENSVHSPNTSEIQPTTAGHVNGVSATSNQTSVQIGVLRKKMYEIFDSHITNANRDAFTALINDRAQQLHDMGQTPENIDQVMKKGARLDRVAKAAAGAVSSAPFAVASVILDRVPVLTEKGGSSAMKGLISGTASGAADKFGESLVKDALEDTLWLGAPAKKLEDVMVKAQGRKQASLGQQSLKAGIAIQAYSLRNVARLAATAVVTATKGPTTAASLDLAISSAGGLLAGAGFASQLHQNDLRDHRVGPEYLLGRIDWKESYRALADSTVKEPLINGTKVMGKIALSVMTGSLRAVRETATATSIIGNVGALGGGFAATGALQELARGQAARLGAGPAALSAVGHAVNTAVSSVVFPAWTTAGIYAGPGADKGVELVQTAVPKAAAKTAEAAEATLDHISEGATSLYSSASHKAGEVSARIDRAATSGADFVSSTINRLLQRRTRGPENEGNSEV